MLIFLIANPKGGAGKSTVATNLAGYFARRGHATMLGDLDRQQSALSWLEVRPSALPRIQSWDRSDEKVARPPCESRQFGCSGIPEALEGRRIG